ncbi:universal stress protein [uncultured Thiodictyon sp.]|uniref:universal stress protein n=1 Tax=uncultured Thiodictyon sp. TaxID=1846217 RepID=UPI0034530387
MMDSGHYTHLLLAVDFDPSGAPVIARAGQLRTLFGARLTLLHVLEHVSAAQEYLPLGFGGDLPVPDDLGLEQELLDIAQHQLDVVGDALGVAAGDRLVRVGPPGHTIDAVAAEVGADLVIVGSHGQHGFLGLFGSTAKAVLRSLKCDVLCVKLAEASDV